MVQHIRKKHPEFALLPITTQTAMISTTPTVLTADGTSGETVVVSVCYLMKVDILRTRNSSKNDLMLNVFLSFCIILEHAFSE